MKRVLLVMVVGLSCIVSLSAHAAADYPSTPEGLKQLWDDLIAAAKDDDTKKVRTIWKSLEIPKQRAWFVKVFGNELGPKVYLDYWETAGFQLTISDEYAEDFVAGMKKQINSGRWADVSVKQSKKGDKNGTGLQEAFHSKSLIAIPLYSVVLSSKGSDSGLRLWSFAYIDGGWRLLGKLRESLGPYTPGIRDEPPKDGPHVEYYENGKKKYEAHYKNGKLDGLATRWHVNGQKWMEKHYKNGKLDGPSTRWYENGKKKVEGHYKDGKLVSASVWKPDGEPCPITKIVDGTGILTYWYNDGTKFSETHYKNGVEDGLWTTWYPNGQKQYEEHYKDGKLDGRWTQWLGDGQKFREIHYKDGKQDGRWTQWFGDGKKDREAHYKDGKKDGLRTRWYENGQKAEERRYKDGKLISIKPFRRQREGL